jgi:hypothetical protein
MWKICIKVPEGYQVLDQEQESHDLRESNLGPKQRTLATRSVVSLRSICKEVQTTSVRHCAVHKHYSERTQIARNMNTRNNAVRRRHPAEPETRFVKWQWTRLWQQLRLHCNMRVKKRAGSAASVLGASYKGFACASPFSFLCPFWLP